MDNAAVWGFMAAARACAMEMLGNATYIEKELDNVRMSDADRKRTKEICKSLVGTKHDIFSELFELDDLLTSGAKDHEVLARAGLIVKWLREDIVKLHGLVQALLVESREHPGDSGAYILVAESATNILNAFSRVDAAMEALDRPQVRG